nr:SAGA complex phosphatidylinositol pseudokinase Tra1 [Schizosaccharomyces pombe]Q9HFE8.1 RecName: Full=Transcription-associated protein 1 [Schizosaccharomyces pombe 972h-]CAC08542.1 SAGA complex phosphatidylinositol pseudokinase Tra1 [Schizosaccharomyces pombe]|eukprot:NP_595777.1 SAGA complex phosphatidylinositol pseudokinase Tra1 [Schizosaccharomyces pombe]
MQLALSHNIPIVIVKYLGKRIRVQLEFKKELAQRSKHLMDVSQCEHWHNRLCDVGLDSKQKANTAIEIRDALDDVLVTEKTNFETFIPLLEDTLSLLEKERPVFSSLAATHRLRIALLELLKKSGSYKGFEAFVNRTFAVLLRIVVNDNEEMAVLALKLVVLLFKDHSSLAKGHVQEFLSIVVENYKSMTTVVSEAFPPRSAPNTPSSHPMSAASSASPAEIGMEHAGPKMIPKASSSFKVTAEFPIIVFLLFQTYKDLIPKMLPLLAPLVLQFISLRPPPQAEARRLAESQKEVFIGVVPSLRRNHLYNDLISAQIKSFSFLAYLLRSFGAALKQFESSIPICTLQLFMDCPSELYQTRRELLVATRHVLSTDYLRGFLPYVDQLLDTKILVGSGITSQHSLRPMAFSMLADMLHYVRMELSPQQIYKVILLYFSILMDDFYTSAIQAMATKLILNLVERIVALEDFSTSRSLLFAILLCLLRKLTSLNFEFMKLRDSLQENADLKQIKIEENKHDLPMFENPTGAAQPSGLDKLKDCIFLFKNTLLGIKPVLFGLKQRNIPLANGSIFTAQEWSEKLHLSSTNEVLLFRRLLVESLKGFSYYQTDEKTGVFKSSKNLAYSQLDSSLTTNPSKLLEEKELLEMLATLFLHLDPSVFVEILESEFPNIFECLVDNLALLHIFQFWMSNEVTSVNCTGIVLSFCCDNLAKIGSGQSTRVSVLLRLFKLAFMTVNVFPEKNAEVLRPHISYIISTSLELTTDAVEPLNYVYLMKALFRNISGGKFDSLYKEILPLLQVMLECFNRLIFTVTSTSQKELYAELCLTLPIRLSVLLPHMNFLMKPLIVALKGPPEIASQGLRIFELCLDNLTQEFLDPLLDSIMPDLLICLWNHSRLNQSNNQLHQSAVRILGKMGGRNRQIYLGTFGFDFLQDENIFPSIQFSFQGSSQNFSLEHSKFLMSSCAVLNNQNSDLEEKKQAFQMVKNSYLLLFASAKPDEDFWESIDTMCRAVVDRMDKNLQQVSNGRLCPDKDESYYLQRSIVSNIFKSLVGSMSCVEFVAEARETINRSLEWLIVLDLVNYADSLQIKDQNIFDNLQSIKMLDLTTCINGIFESLCSENENTRSNALSCIDHYLNAHKMLLNTTLDISKLPSFQNLVTVFCQSCHKELWYQKNAGFLGLKAILSYDSHHKLWIQDRLHDILKALFFILKDTPTDYGVLKLTEVRSFIVDITTQFCILQDVLAPKERANNIINAFSPFFLELLHPNDHVRNTVQQAIENISNNSKLSVVDLLLPIKDRLLSPIFGKPLRALPFTIQIGHIDAITYCLHRSPSFLDLTDELYRLFRETIALADAEDEALVTMLKTSQSKDSSSLRKLRATCLHLLFASLVAHKFDQPQHAQTRTKIIAIFFKDLYSPHKEIYSVAIDALRHVLSQNQKLPKELLQSGLRPILMNLSDHNKLSVNGLEGLSRLLRLLTNYFKVEIGRKLLQHLNVLSDSKVLETASLSLLKTNPRIEIIVSLVNVFRDLPPLSAQFLGDLLSSVVNIEAVLRKYSNSPLRKPLYSFMDLHANDTWMYILNNARNGDLITRFVGALNDPMSEKLRETAGNYWGKLLELISQPVSVENLAPMYAVDIIATVFPYISANVDAGVISAKFIVLSKSLYGMLSSYNEYLFLPIRRCISSITKMLLSSLKKIEKKLEFSLEVFRFKADDDNDFLPEYIDSLCGCLITSTSAAEKKSIFLVCCSIVGDKSVRPFFKAFLLDKVINPLVFKSCGENNFIDKDVVHSVYTHVWRVSIRDFAEVSGATDSFYMGIMCLTTALCKYHSALLNDYRKSVIMSAWNYIKLEDPMVKQAAYATIACFISAYDTPAKIVTPVYVSILKTYQPEVRAFIEFSLASLLSVLTARLSSPSDSTFPLWAKLPRLVISEDVQGISQPLTVYQFICKAPDLFFSCCSHFIVPMVNALPKLVSFSSASTEPRKLALDIVQTFINWQRKQNESENSETTLFSNSHIEAILTFLIKFLSLFPEPVEENPLSKKGLSLFNDLFSFPRWKDCQLNSNFFEKILVDMDFNDNNYRTVANTLFVFGVILKNRGMEYIQREYSHIIALIDKSLRCGKLPVTHSLEQIILLLLQSHPTQAEEEEDTNEADDFKQLLLSVIHDNLAAATNIESAICYLQIVKSSNPEALDGLLLPLNKCFQKVARDHIVACMQSAIQASGKVTLPSASDTVSKLLISFIEIIRVRMASLGDQRRWFLSVVVQLLEKSSSFELCEHILNVTKEWVIVKRDSFLTVKEKTALLLKMRTFEGRFDNKLYIEACDLLSTIYRDPIFAHTELTARLKQAFLLATASKDTKIRMDFMDIFDSSMSRNVYSRLTFILDATSWDTIPSIYWIKQANYILLGAINAKQPVRLTDNSLRFAPVPMTKPILSSLPEVFSKHNGSAIPLGRFTFFKQLDLFLKRNKELTVQKIIFPLAHIQMLSDADANKLWQYIFPLAWKILSSDNRSDLSKSLIYLLTRDYHIKQVNNRPNVISTLVSSFVKCAAKLELPPHLVKYLGKLYGVYHESVSLLEIQLSDKYDMYQNAKVQESRADAVAELYASLNEDDMFYGHWRRNCKYLQTQVALSYEQLGMWGRAQQLYEQAQTKARSEAIPFSESEYNLWEDQWVMCAQKLQQWDVLTELAKHEGSSELLLECAWRISDWSNNRESLEVAIKSLSDVPTPRKLTFQCFMTLQKSVSQPLAIKEFQQVLSEAIQLALIKWHQLPEKVNQSHYSLLHLFQQFVELQEAATIYSHLNAINFQNLPTNVQLIKSALQVWQERLPNVWDDINLWRDLISWRQIVFSMINRVYLPLVPTIQANSSADSSNPPNTSFLFRGYHETAWLINRFAHVARKHKLPSVCLNQLTKIYTLPNIEIQEAFYKLREQVLCYLQNPRDLKTGLEVVTNTNLMYFNSRQKSEFVTLKGKFLEKLNRGEEANQMYAAAVQIDLGLPKAWAEWGRYNDLLFNKSPDNLSAACNAISCYLQAAGTYQSSKARKMLARVLWLLSLNDSAGTIVKAFESYKGDIPVWHWLTFIPQLLNSLSKGDTKCAPVVLKKIAKSYPQALFFTLRTAREDIAQVKRTEMAAWKSNTTDENKRNEDILSIQSNFLSTNQSTNAPATNKEDGLSKKVWEYIDEIMSILKTAYPLLALTMETLVDQIQAKFKCKNDGDAFRLVVALLNDAVQHSIRLGIVTDEMKLPSSTESNLSLFADNILPDYCKQLFKEDFIVNSNGLKSYIFKLRKWRSYFERLLSKVPKKQYLEQYSSFLCEFHHQKFDEIEVPGQYLLHKDNNNSFSCIERFLPEVELIVGHGVCYRRLSIRSNGGTIHPFVIQYPSARNSRREERFMQLTRYLNDALALNCETRRRCLKFYIPAVIPLSSHIRLLEDQPSSITLQKIYEIYSERNNFSRDDPKELFTNELSKHMMELNSQISQESTDAEKLANRKQLFSRRIGMFENIQKLYSPSTILKDYFSSIFTNYSDLWLFRKNFSYQYACFSFITYILSINNRIPAKLVFSRDSGGVWTTEALPSMVSSTPVYHNGEIVPFRFTPNIKEFIGKTCTEGLLGPSIMAIARALSKPDFDLDMYLGIFIRDDLFWWLAQQTKGVPADFSMLNKVNSNTDLIMRRVASLSQVAYGNLPVNQTAIDYLAQASSSKVLAQMDVLWAPWL